MAAGLNAFLLPRLLQEGIEDLECTRDAILAAPDQCAYAERWCDDTGVGSFGSYVVHWYCAFHGNAMGMLPLGLWLLSVMLALCSTADTFLMPVSTAHEAGVFESIILLTTPKKK